MDLRAAGQTDRRAPASTEAERFAPRIIEGSGDGHSLNERIAAQLKLWDQILAERAKLAADTALSEPHRTAVEAARAAVQYAQDGGAARIGDELDTKL
jgi:hypothetical protein